MARSIGLHLSGRAPGPGPANWDFLRDLVAGAVLLAVWGAIWAFLVLGVAGPLGSLQGAAPRPTAAAVEGSRS